MGSRTGETVMSEQPVGVVTHYFGKVGVAGISMIKGRIEIGDTISIIGHTTNFEQVIESMQIDHEPVEAAKAGDDIGIRVNDRVRVNDKVYRVS
jgi:translation initiation factor IF-2